MTLRICLIAGSLERGRDGVGDYTRCLAEEAIRRDASCRMLAIADRHVRDTVIERGNAVDVMRLPFAMPWRTRIRLAADFLHEPSSDWVSLQFVPYSFDDRGFAGAAVRAIRGLAGRARLHVMLHEIWIDGSASLGKRLVSAAQRRAIRRLCAHPDALIHTSNRTYQAVLETHGVRARVLPLFGSIPIAVGAVSWLAPVLAAAGCDALTGRRDGWWLFAIFGALHTVWPPLPLLADLQSAAEAVGKRVALISIGRIGRGEELWNEMVATHGHRVSMVRLGEQPEHRISQVLQTVDYGIATTPLQLLGKSATVAAMFDHGLPVVVNREDCCWTASAPADAREAALVIRSGEGLGDRLRDVCRWPPRWTLPDVAGQWLGELSAAGTVTP